MEITPINCEEGSAWHAWQAAGYEWRENNRGVPIHEGAAHFANVLNANERYARYAAFKEGTEYFDRMALYQNHTVAFYAGH